ncbi:MAG: DUF2029 domain-containing protein [Chloroflexi bacterium]|nr:DUF2029 domain-containing protein [Chloroflexota bacterium]
MADVMEINHDARQARQGKILIAIGILSLVPYLYALSLQDLRAHTVEFEGAFFAAFALYVAAVVIVLRDDSDASRTLASRAHLPWRAAPGSTGATNHGSLLIIFAFAIIFNVVLIFTPPTLSDDMYRYVWDGRVQAQRINPYAYPPNAAHLENLRDDVVWQQINRKDAVTVYPAGAELAYAAIWRIVPDNVRWFQIVMAAGNILAGVLLVLLLRALGKPDHWVLIYVWHPLVIFETAHAAHVDGLVLPLLVAAWLARAKGRDVWVGVFLGAATALKLYPALLLPALWRWRDDQGRLRAAWQMPFAFAATFALIYVPYLSQGSGVIGFLPQYLNERFNIGLAGIVTDLIEKPPAPIFQAVAHAVNGSASPIVNLLMFAALALIGLVMLLRPAPDAEQAIRRSIWLIGAFTLLTQNLFPWYMLWLVPLLALFVRPGKLGLAFDAWTGWFVFSGLVALAYTFFIVWRPVAWALSLEFIPLYLFLILPSAWNWFKRFRARIPILERQKIFERNA